MAYKSTYKAQAIAEDLKAAIAVRLPSLAQVASNDSEGNPCVLVGAAAAASPGAFIRIKPVDSLVYDIIGHDQAVFTPHIAQIAFEANYAATDDNVADVNGWDTILPLIGELTMRGLKVEVYASNSGTAPSVDTLVTAKLKASFEPHPQYPQVIGQ